jgi:hypothetical protein
LVLWSMTFPVLLARAGIPPLDRSGASGIERLIHVILVVAKSADARRFHRREAYAAFTSEMN